MVVPFARSAASWSARRWLPHLAIFALVAVLYLFGTLEFVELRLMDARFSLLGREAKGDLVVVEIDPQSLQELQTWPWSRSVHAQLTQRLLEAGARQIAFDVDFSSPANPDGDAAFESALSRAGERVILPVFQQFVTADNGGTAVFLSIPLPRFAEHTALASINVRPDSDGLIRRMSAVEPWGDARIPSLSTFLAEESSLDRGEFYIDYGISPPSIPRLSYVDVLRGRFDPAEIANKIVVVGATAVELSDFVATPIYRALPGPVVHAMAYESLVQGRALQRFEAGAILAAGLVLALLFALLLARRSRVGGFVTLGFWIAGASAGAIGVQAFLPLTLDTTPWIFSAVLSYAYNLVSRIKQLDLRLLIQGRTLRRQGAFTRGVLENTFDAIITIDQSGDIRTFNRTAERMFQVSAVQAVGTSIRTLLSPELTPEQASEVFGAPGGPHQVNGLRGDGETFAVEVVVSTMVQDEEQVFIALARDVSVEKRAQAKAAKARTYLLHSIESVSDGFVLYDSDDGLVLYNSKFREIVGEAIDLSVPGTRHEDILRALAESGRLHENHLADQEWLRDRERRHRGQVGAYEVKFSDGRWFRVNKSRTFDGGVVGTYTDITELKQREESLIDATKIAEAANRSKTEFLHNMSHELRTPLNAIIGFSEVIEKELLGPIGTSQYVEYAKDIHSSGSHLLDIINDILDLAKIEAGKYELEETEVDLVSAIHLCHRLVSDRAQRAGHTISINVLEDMIGLYADDRAVKQILINLLSNAIKFTPDGGKISVNATLADDGSAALSVTDNGIGIAEENILTVLSDFGQIDGGLTRQYEGTGLGVPLVKWLAKLHGGSLHIQSEVDVGTTMTVSFPAERVRRRLSAVAAASAEKSVGAAPNQPVRGNSGSIPLAAGNQA